MMKSLLLFFILIQPRPSNANEVDIYFKVPENSEHGRKDFLDVNTNHIEKNNNNKNRLRKPQQQNWKDNRDLQDLEQAFRDFLFALLTCLTSLLTPQSSSIPTQIPSSNGSTNPTSPPTNVSSNNPSSIPSNISLSPSSVPTNVFSNEPSSIPSNFPSLVTGAFVEAPSTIADSLEEFYNVEDYTRILVSSDGSRFFVAPNMIFFEVSDAMSFSNAMTARLSAVWNQYESQIESLDYAMSADGHTMMFLNYELGEVLVLNFNGLTWVQKGNAITGLSTFLPGSETRTQVLDISDDGNKILFGSLQGVHLFDFVSSSSIWESLSVLSTNYLCSNCDNLFYIARMNGDATRAFIASVTNEANSNDWHLSYVSLPDFNELSVVQQPNEPFMFWSFSLSSDLNVLGFAAGDVEADSFSVYIYEQDENTLEYAEYIVLENYMIIPNAITGDGSKFIAYEMQSNSFKWHRLIGGGEIIESKSRFGYDRSQFVGEIFMSLSNDGDVFTFVSDLEGYIFGVSD